MEGVNDLISNIRTDEQASSIYNYQLYTEELDRKAGLK